LCRSELAAEFSGRSGGRGVETVPEREAMWWDRARFLSSFAERSMESRRLEGIAPVDVVSTRYVRSHEQVICPLYSSGQEGRYVPGGRHWPAPLRMYQVM